MLGSHQRHFETSLSRLDLFVFLPKLHAASNTIPCVGATLAWMNHYFCGIIQPQGTGFFSQLSTKPVLGCRCFFLRDGNQYCSFPHVILLWDHLRGFPISRHDFRPKSLILLVNMIFRKPANAIVCFLRLFRCCHWSQPTEKVWIHSCRRWTRRSILSDVKQYFLDMLWKT